MPEESLIAMMVVKNYFLLFLLLDIFLPGVASRQTTDIKNKQSKQNLLLEITQDLAKKDVDCLNYFSETSGESFLFNIPTVNLM